MTRVLCDIDGVLANFVAPMLSWVQKNCAETYTYHEIDCYPGYDRFSPAAKKAVLSRMAHDATFCYNIPRMPGAQQFLKDLVTTPFHEFEVHLVTSPFPGPHWKQAREEWITSLCSSPLLQKITWEFISEERKNLPGEFLIEDRYDSALAWANTDRYAILVDHPWNKGEHHSLIRRVADLKDALETIRKLDR